MKFGFCVGMDKCDSIKKAGFDFIELGVGTVVPDQSEEKFQKIKKELDKLSLPVLAFNCFIPGSFSIIKSYMEGKEDVLLYAKTAIRRVAEAGGKVIVFGSGWARRRPDDVDRDTALKMLESFSRDCGEAAREYGVTIAIEHLNRRETNTVNSTKEALELIKRVDHPNVKLLVDSYHMMVEGEEPEDLQDHAEYIAHVHLADGSDRSYPHKDLEFYKKLGDILKKSGYTGGISVECGLKDFEAEIVKTMDVLQKTFG